MAAEQIQKQPVAIQLRYLQTLVEIGAERTRPSSPGACGHAYVVSKANGLCGNPAGDILIGIKRVDGI